MFVVFPALTDSTIGPAEVKAVSPIFGPAGFKLSVGKLKSL